MIKRREFIAGLGSVAAWPLTAWAQQGDRVRRIGVLSPYVENDAGTTSYLSRFMQRLAELGWMEGRNLKMEIRWTAGNVDRMRTFAKELIDLQPDVIFTDSTPQTAAFQRETRTIPIVFVLVSDPIGSGFVDGLARPGGNITGFMSWEPTMAGQVAPAAHGNRARRQAGRGHVQSRHGSLCKPILPTLVRSGCQIAQYRTDRSTRSYRYGNRNGHKRAWTRTGGGFVSLPDTFTGVHRATMISLAAENNVPAIYQDSIHVKDGGLLSYGADLVDIYYRSASYVDRILRCAKPADLPVQLPVKFKTAVNLKTAKALGLTVPQSILLSADEVIE